MPTRRKKNRNLGPRRKRMRRQSRLQAAVKWCAGYGGKNIVRGYARWFGVDLICAITELRTLGISIDAEYVQQVRRAIAARAETRARRRAAKVATAKRAELEWATDWPVEWIPDDEEVDARSVECPF